MYQPCSVEARTHARAMLGTAVSIPACGPLPAQRSVADPTLDTVVVARRIKEQLYAKRALTPGTVTILDVKDSWQRSVTQLSDLLRYVQF